MISYGKQTIDQSDIDAVVDSLNSDWLTQGPRVKNFENDLSEHFGALYTCAVSNGTAALHLVAKILNWKPDDIIITTPITFLATANCIEYVGASVDFVDIDLDTYTINTKLLDEKIHKFLTQSYQKYGYEVLEVPFGTLEERMKFMGTHLEI